MNGQEDKGFRLDELLTNSEANAQTFFGGGAQINIVLELFQATYFVPIHLL